MSQFSAPSRSLEPKQKPVVEVARIINAIGVADERIEHGANLGELVPVPTQARQARHLDAEHEASSPSPTSATRRWKPGRPSIDVPEHPWSSSITTTALRGWAN